MARTHLRRALDQKLRGLRTIPGLRRAQPLAQAADGLDDRALAFAAQNPDHSPAGQAMARAALQARLGATEAQAAMDRVVNDTPTQGFLNAADIANDDRVFFGLGRWLRILAGLAASAATLASIGVFVFLMGQPTLKDAVEMGLVPEAEYQAYMDMPIGEARSAVEARLEALPGVAEVVAGENAAVQSAANWVWASWLSFPLWAFVTASRRKPARVLLLRKFNDRGIGRSLEKMSNRNLRPYGHVFTLADKHFKRNAFLSFVSQFWVGPFTMLMRMVTVPVGMVRRLWDRSRDGPILVWHARDFQNFVRRFEDRGGLNLEMARTQRKAIMVRTSDAWWQHVVEVTMHAVDVIVVDLTEVSAGTVWELQKIPAENVGERVVFTVREDRIDSAKDNLRLHGFPQHVDAVQVYKRNGVFLDAPAFREALRAAMVRRLSPVAAES